MRKNISLFLYLLLAAPLLAQRDIPLSGLVVRQNSRVKTGQVEYLSKVSIQATQAAAPTMSDATGSFTLVFADKPAYNVTRIFAEKSGMEVVNKTDLERAAVIGRLDKLKIVMCPAGEQMESQMQYYGIAQEAIVSRFKKRIAALEAANTDLDKLIVEVNEEFNLDLKTKNEAFYALEKEWSEALASAQETALKFAAINLDDADSLYLQADAAFKKGDFTRVLQLLQYDLLDKNLRNIRSNLSAADSLSAEGRARIARGQENLRHTIQNALLAARVAKFDGAWKRAEAYYDLAAKHGSNDIDIVDEAAEFFKRQNKIDKSKFYYELALSIAIDTLSIISARNGYGSLLLKTKNFEEAIINFNKSMELSIPIVEKHPQLVIENVLFSLNNLGLVYEGMGDYMKSQKIYEFALQAIAKYIDEYNSICAPFAADIYNNLGKIFMKNLNYEKALLCYKYSLLIRQELVTYYPEMQEDMCTTTGNIANLYTRNNDLDSSIQYYVKSLEFARNLSKKNPDRYRELEGQTLINFANYYNESKNDSMCLALYSEALNIFNLLFKVNPQIYTDYIGTIYQNLGSFASEGKKYNDAINYYIQSYNSFNLYLMYVDKSAIALTSLGRTCYDIKDYKNSEIYLNNSLERWEKISDKISVEQRVEKLKTYLWLGLLYEHFLKEDGVMDYKVKGFTLMTSAIMEVFEIPNFENNSLVNNIYNELSRLSNFFGLYTKESHLIYKMTSEAEELTNLNKKEKDNNKKIENQKEILKILINTESKFPTNFELKNKIVNNYGILSWYQITNRQFKEAEESAISGLKKDSTVIWINTHLVVAYLYQGKWDLAQDIYLKFKDSPFDKTAHFKDVFKQDLNELEELGITHPDVVKARYLLK